MSTDNSHTLIGGTLVHVEPAMVRSLGGLLAAGTGVSLLGEL